jgi:hypothetical protein
MSFEAKITDKKLTWFDALVAQGHTPVLNECGDLDVFVCNVGHHNGPGCSTCHWDDCWHCLKPTDIPKCKGEKA